MGGLIIRSYPANGGGGGGGGGISQTSSPSNVNTVNLKIFLNHSGIVT